MLVIKQLFENNILLNYQVKDLDRFEPERNKSKVKKILYTICFLMIIIIVILQIFLSKISEIGNEKSQTISMVSKSDLAYNMTWTLLPLHRFNFFMLHEVDKRMKCFADESDPEVCMEFCQALHELP